MSANRTLVTSLACATIALGTAAGAQETRGVPLEPTAGTVIKAKAPVAKELLRVRFPRPKTFKLKNGLAVYVLEDHRLPAVTFSLTMRAGAVFESKPAVAEMTAAMLTEGTTTRDSRQLSEQIEDMGAQLGAGAAIDTTTLSCAGLSSSTDQLIALMADVLQRPTFPAERLDRVRFDRRSQVAQRRTNPRMILADVAAKVYYGGTPYGRVSPTAAQIAAVTREDLVAFHDAYYRPNGALLGVTGDVDTGSLRRKLEEAFGGWKPAAHSAEPPPAAFHPAEAAHVYLVDRPASAQTVLAFGNLAVRESDPDYIPLVVANRILGGGSSGRLFQNIRERKGYTYGAYSTIAALRWPAVWESSASVRTPVTEPAAQEFFNEFARLEDETVPDEELERAKRSIIGGFALTLESPEGVLRRSLDIVENGLPADYWDTYPQRIQAVTAADVQRVALKYLGKGRVQVIAIGERSKIEDGLKQFGPVEVVNAAQLDSVGPQAPPRSQ